MKDYDRALAASDRALARAYGPRKINVYSVRSDIYKEKGDLEGAKEVIRQAIAFAKTLPEEQRRDQRVASLEKRLAGMQ
jgi:Tfp pilus assembly protein PilF